MVVDLILSSRDLGVDDIHKLTADLCKTIIEETDIDAKLDGGKSHEVTRGDPITLGLIVLTFISSGAAVGLFDVLKSYFEREPSMQLDLQREDGARLSLNAKNMRPEEIDETFNRAREFLEKS